MCTEEDCDKLRRLIHYVTGTMDLMACIGATDLLVLMHFIDAAYAIYNDFRSHIGSTTTLGYGIVYSMSPKQKININSSTHAELVSVSNYFPKLLYAKLFLKVQDIALKRNIMYQDNTSVMLMKKNRKLSCSKRSCHLNTRYFYVMNTVKQKEMEIMHYPKEVIITNFFLKPLQGNLFKRF